MKRIHYWSGLVMTIFIGLHLFNHLISVFGAEAHMEVMDKLRVVYRNTIGETILLMAVLVQIISGLKLFFSKRKYINNKYERLQIWSGLYLAFFLLIHVTAVLAGRFLFKLDTNFYFGVAALNTFPLSLFFIPYYALAILAFFGHVSAIHYQKMRLKIMGVSVNGQSKAVLIVGLIVTMAIFYGLTNGFSGVEFPKEYNVLVGK